MGSAFGYVTRGNAPLHPSNWRVNTWCSTPLTGALTHGTYHKPVVYWNGFKDRQLAFGIKGLAPCHGTTVGWQPCHISLFPYSDAVLAYTKHNITIAMCRTTRLAPTLL
jgi:hypothetical protein